ncbi:MAG: hypothetical protein HZB63_05055 [Deltaproteobacteria bacterium]|nr:hypothetical protein [Deltaproteobacteria bacterium]
MSVVALALACLLFAPQADADDFAFPSLKGTISVRMEIFTAMEDDGFDSRDSFICPVCMEGLGESFAPLVLPPRAGELFSNASRNLASSLFSPEIFRPPA